MGDTEDFKKRNRDSVDEMQHSATLNELSRAWYDEASKHEYSYHFESLGLPIIQMPQDIQALNEIIWRIRPDLVIETGVARGGSLINSAAQLALLDVCDAFAGNGQLHVKESSRKVVGIDIDIRPHNREAIETHPLGGMIQLIQGSSTEVNVLAQVNDLAEKASCVLILLDSNHTHEHVLAELKAYAPLVTTGSYCVVYDTIVEFMPSGSFPNRPWDVGNNPWTAVKEYLTEHPEFVSDPSISAKLQISVAPDGYLMRVK